MAGESSVSSYISRNPSDPMRIAVQARHPEPSTLPLIAGLLKAMPDRGLTPVVDGQLAALLAATGSAVQHTTFDAGAPPAGTDLLMSLGGDGTFLRAVGLVARSGVPVLGVEPCATVSTVVWVNVRRVGSGAPRSTYTCT